MKKHARFEAAESARWLPSEPFFPWEKIQGALQTLLDNGFIKIKARNLVPRSREEVWGQFLAAGY